MPSGESSISYSSFTSSSLISSYGTAGELGYFGPFSSSAIDSLINCPYLPAPKSLLVGLFSVVMARRKTGSEDFASHSLVAADEVGEV